MKCQATKVYENHKIGKQLCDEDATVSKTESPAVKQLNPPIVSDKQIQHLCAKCAEAYEDFVNGEKCIYYDCVNGEKLAYQIIFGG